MALEKQVTAREEPLSPFSQLFSFMGDDCINVVTIGFETEFNPLFIVEGIKKTLINHPRFSSIMICVGQRKREMDSYPSKVEEHVVIPEIDPNIDNPDDFLEDYTSNIARTPMDKSKPLWEFHLLKMKTSHAESVAVGRFHHSLGDGMSLMSLLLACTRKISDPQALPTFAVASKKSHTSAGWFWSMVAPIWYIMRVIFYTFVEGFLASKVICFGGDTATPFVSKSGATLSPNKFIHRIISLEDVKFVKKAMKMTVNDVLLGVVQAGLSRYLTERRYELETTSKSGKSLERLSLHGTVFFNLRPNKNIEDLATMMAKGSKVKWGNSIGFVMLPLHMKSENDTFEFVRQSKGTMDRKKLSLEPLLSYALFRVITQVFGSKALNSFVRRILRSSTMIFTNVIGPTEEISFFDHHISYIAATTVGLPQALIINIQSYVNKVIFNLGVDVDVIPDPHHLCDLIVEALSMMKTATAEKICHGVNENGWGTK